LEQVGIISTRSIQANRSDRALYAHHGERGDDQNNRHDRDHFDRGKASILAVAETSLSRSDALSGVVAAECAGVDFPAH